MLIQDDIDFTPAMMMSKGRSAVLDFAWPVYNSKITLLGSRSSGPRLNAWVYVDVFPITAWITGLAAIIVAALIFSVSCGETIPQGLNSIEILA